MLQYSVKKRSEKNSRELFSVHPIVTEYRDERQGIGGGNICCCTPSDKMTQEESGLKKFFQVITLKEFYDFFFSNQNHANQRKEHKKLLSFALIKKHNKETSY